MNVLKHCYHCYEVTLKLGQRLETWVIEAPDRTTARNEAHRLAREWLAKGGESKLAVNTWSILELGEQ